MTWTHTRPPAPRAFASSTRPSSSLRPPSPLPGYHDRFDRAPAVQDRTEHLDLGRCEHISKVDQLQPEAEIGLVGPEPLHRLLEGDARELRELDAHHFGPHRFEHPLRHIEDVVHLDERHLHVELGEVGLPVGAQVLVPEAASDLVVAVEAAHHQQLLEELWALRQCVELPGVDARGNEVVARSLGCRAGEHRCLDLGEALARRRTSGSTR